MDARQQVLHYVVVLRKQGCSAEDVHAMVDAVFQRSDLAETPDEKADKSRLAVSVTPIVIDHKQMKKMGWKYEKFIGAIDGEDYISTREDTLLGCVPAVEDPHRDLTTIISTITRIVANDSVRMFGVGIRQVPPGKRWTSSLDSRMTEGQTAKGNKPSKRYVDRGYRHILAVAASKRRPNALQTESALRDHFSSLGGKWDAAFRDATGNPNHQANAYHCVYLVFQ